jgi:ATP-dependent DNA helicase RecG
MTSEMLKDELVSVFKMDGPECIPFVMPSSYLDYRYPLTRFDATPESPAGILIRGVISSPPVFGFTGSNKPRLQIVLSGEGGTSIRVSLYGYDQERDTFMSSLYRAGRPVHFHGSAIMSIGAFMTLNRPVFVDSRYVGRITPVYPAKRGKMKADQVRRAVLMNIDPYLEPAACKLLSLAFPGSDTQSSKPVSDMDRDILTRISGSDAMPTLNDWPSVRSWLTSTLRMAHMPPSHKHGYFARTVLANLGALSVVVNARIGVASRGQPRFSPSQTCLSFLERAPFPLTPSQIQTLKDIDSDFAAGECMRRVLTGDVGCGKTIVYLAAAISFVESGGTAAILLPSDILSQQIFGDALALVDPGTESIVRIVAGGSPPESRIGLPTLYIGTTALLHQLPPGTVDFVITDEQHKFGSSQRDVLAGKGVHALEVSATPIPRTQALIEFAGIPISTLESHTQKNIVTKVFNQFDRGELFSSVRKTLSLGDKVLVVYPLKETSAGSSSELQNVQDALDRWRHSLPEASIEMIHAGLPVETVTSALSRFRDGTTQIILSTSITETGLNIPGLMHVVVINAERYGLTSLHQIRGRCARHGGVGHFDLLPSPNCTDASMERLHILENETDGFKVAAANLRLKGGGDIFGSGTRQSGSVKSIYYGPLIETSHLELATAILDRV